MEQEPIPETDAELMRRSRRDPQAFDAVYVRHARAIHAWLDRQLGDGVLAWELTAEVFAQAWISRRRFRPGGEESDSAAPWLFGIAKNVHRHWARRRRAEARATRRLGMQVDLATPDDEDDRLERLAVAALGDDLRASLDRLPSAQREAVRLRVVEEFSYEVIARRLDCTTDTVRMRVMRGLRALNTDLQGRLP